MATRTVKVFLVGEADGGCVAAKKILAQMSGLVADVTSLPSGAAALKAIGNPDFDGCLLLAFLPPQEENEILEQAGKLKLPAPMVVLTEGEPHLPASGMAEVLGREELSAKLLERALRYMLEKAEAVKKMNALNEELERKVMQLDTAQSELATKTRKLEQVHDQAREATQLKAEIVANIGHDLRSLMSSIIGMSELLQSTTLTDEQRNYSSTLQDSSQSILTIVNDILEFSKIEADKLDVQILDFPPLTLVERTAQLMTTSASSAKLQLYTFVDPDLPPLLRGDPLRLRQILLNFLSNALKFSKRGEVVLRALKQGEDSTTVKVRFEVQDSGAGLSPERRKQLFKPLSLHEKGKERFGGTGLGLSICKRLVELMDGEIGVDSVEGQGSTFWFSVKLERTPNYSSGSKTLLSAIAADLSAVSVLVVDPSATSREILKHYLCAAGIHTGTARNATESMAALIQQARSGKGYDVAIVSPAGDAGHESKLARQAGNNKLLTSTKFVLVRDANHNESPESLAEAGFAGCLSRPVKQLQLIELVAGLTEKPAGVSHPASSVETLAAPPAEQAAASQSSPPADKADQDKRKSLRVLLAEDNQVLRELAVIQLKRLGVTAVAVADGKEALARFTDAEFDLIFLDCQMPEIDGYELTRRIRDSEDGTDKHIPIIAMTASVLPGDRERCLAAGMDDYLSKPINKQQLESLIRRWIKTGTVADPVAAARTNSPIQVESDPIDLVKAKLFYGEKALPDLLKAFVREAGQLVDFVRTAAAENDLAKVLKTAHQLRGLALSFEIHRMVALVSEIERSAQKRQWADIDRTLVNISKILEAVLSSLDRFLSGSQIP